MAFIQKIYDSGLAQFVYYTKATVTTAPLSSETTPNHSGSLVVSTHAILGETGASLLVKDEGTNITLNTRSLNFVGADVVTSATNDDVTVTVAGSGLAGSHSATHIDGAIDELDGDKLNVDFTPLSYTRTIVGGLSTANDQLTSHLKGIDNAIAAIPPPSGETNTASNVGTGTGWYKTKVGVDLQFKSILAGYGNVVSSGTNENTVALKTAITTLTDAGSISIDADDGPNYQVTIAGNRLLANPTNTAVGKKIEILVIQDPVGNRRLNFDSNWVPTSKTFQVALAPNATSVIKAIARGVSTKWYYTIEHSEETQVTDATVTSNQTSWLPDGKSFANLVRVSSDSNIREIQGISPPTQSYEKSYFRMVLTGSFYLRLKHEDNAAVASNRIIIPTLQDLTLSPNDVITFQYDFTDLRWRLS